MPNISYLYKSFKTNGLKQHSLYLASIMIFFWAISDGILSFILPVSITEIGISETWMGIIIGSSSIAGALFDFLLCRFLVNVNFRRLYFLMLAVSVTFPLVLWQAKTIWLYLLAMAIWGLYYDLYHIGNFDFVSRVPNNGERSTGFGVMQVFISLGYLMAPLIAGFLIGEVVNFKPFVMALIFLGLAFVFYFLLLIFTQKTKSYNQKTNFQSLNFFREYRLWKKIGKLILPVLILTFVLNINDSFFWTIGPLFSESLFAHSGFGSLFMVAYGLPPLFIGWFIGSITARFGQKKTAFISLMIGSLILSSLFLVSNPLILILISFVASFFLALAWPAIQGAYADYIAEAPQVATEIETLQDSFVNIGYVVGPIMAGIFGQYFGHQITFSILGATGVLVSLILLMMTPKSIKIKVRRN
ncbi:MAG: MFS transporter [Patescibacteria group bacterium]|jgi:MFS family permease